jgi:TonB family protein
MKRIFVAPLILLSISFYNCARPEYASLENLKYNLYPDSIEVVNIEASSVNPPLSYVAFSVPPKPVHTVIANYPNEAREQGMDGEVLIKMWITSDGNVKRGIVQKTTNSIFNQSALLTAIQWHFSPAYMVNGKPTDIWVAIPFKFHLNH